MRAFFAKRSDLQSYLRNALVFAVLGGLMFLGHHYDWKIPRLSANPLPSEGLVDQSPTPKIVPAPLKKVEPIKTPEPTSVKLASKEALGKTQIHLYEVQQLSTMSEYIHANGTIHYDKTRMAQLSTRASGIVWQVMAKVGDRVKEGDVLALVESVDVGKAKADFLQAVVQFEHKEKMFNVAKSLDGIVAQTEFYEKESQLREARIQKINAQQTLINLGLPITIKECLGLSDEALTRKLHSLGLPDSWAGKLDPARTTANLIPLKAPFAGQIIGTDLVKGEMIQPGQAKVVITDIQSMWLVMDVAIEDAARLRLGQEIDFVADGMETQSVQSKITWISTEADPKTRRVQVRAEAQNVDGNLRANAFGYGKIKVRTEANALVVPQESIHWDLESRSHMIFICKDEQTFEARPVRLGIRSKDMTEVIPLESGTIQPGDKIAAQGSYMMKSELLRRRLASAGR